MKPIISGHERWPLAPSPASIATSIAGETASALRVHHAGRKLGDVARGSSAMPATFYPPLEGLEGEGRSRSERGGVISPRAQMYRFRRPWAGSGTTETPPRGQTVTPPRPHRRCGASSMRTTLPLQGRVRKSAARLTRPEPIFSGDEDEAIIDTEDFER